MHDNFEKQLNEKLKSLHVHNHSSDLWDRVQNDLDFEERINSLAKDLPKYSHRPNLWYSIQNKLEKKGKQIKLYYLSGIAASIILFISIFQYSSNNTKCTLSYSVEIQKNEEQFVASNNEDDINTMLNQICNYSKVDCSSPDFIRIKSELTSLEAEINKLKKVISNYGESDDLVQCMIRMENQKSEFIKELLKS